jgi:hypothetical protein
MYRASVLLLFAFALDTPAQEAATPGEDLLPLAIGNTWTYRVFGQDDRFVVRVARKEMIGEQTCFRLEGQLKDKIVATEHLAFTQDGLTRFRADKEDIFPPVTVLQVPPVRGMEWKTKYQVGERKSTVTFKRDSTTGSIADVPFGRFRAIKIDAEIVAENGSRTWTSIWYASGTGIVKQTIKEGQRPTMLLELEKFEKGE